MGGVVVSIRQQVVPDALHGRVGGAFRLFGYGAMAIGAGMAGAIAQVAGVEAVFATVALLNILLLIPFFTSVTDRSIAAARTIDTRSTMRE